MLVGEKEKKDDIGLDGISIYGVFTPADLKPQAFFLWSPRAGDDAHLMLAATLAKADRLVVMDRGVVVEEGGHDELMAKEGAYYRLVQAQARNVDTDLDDRGSKD